MAPTLVLFMIYSRLCRDGHYDDVNSNSAYDEDGAKDGHALEPLHALVEDDADEEEPPAILVDELKPIPLNCLNIEYQWNRSRRLLI